MVNPGKFADLGKSGKDLLTKDFPTTNELKVETTNSSGVKVLAKATQKPDGTFSGEINPKFFFPAQGAELSVFFTNRNQLRFEGSVKPKAAPGLTLTGKASTTSTPDAKGKSEVRSGSVEAEYRGENFTFTNTAVGAEAISVVSNGVLAASSAVKVGVETEVAATATPKLTRAQVVLLYSGGDFEGSLFAKQLDDTRLDLGMNYFHAITKDLKVASEFTVNANDAKATPAFHLGALYALDSTASFKGRFSTVGRLALSYNQVLGSNARLVVGGDLDTKGTDHKFGFAFSMNS